jgi:hypothetical protein
MFPGFAMKGGEEDAERGVEAVGGAAGVRRAAARERPHRVGRAGVL